MLFSQHGWKIYFDWWWRWSSSGLEYGRSKGSSMGWGARLMGKCCYGASILYKAPSAWSSYCFRFYGSQVSAVAFDSYWSSPSSDSTGESVMYRFGSVGQACPVFCFPRLVSFVLCDSWFPYFFYLMLFCYTNWFFKLWPHLVDFS